MSSATPLRVFFLIDSFQMGGAERITAALLPHFDPKAVIPLICTLNTRKESPLIQQLQGIQSFNLAAKRLLDPFAFRRLLTLLHDRKVDLIHAQLQDATLMAALAHQLTNLPLVVTRHVLADDSSNWRRSWRSRLERFAVRTSAARVVSVSKAAGAYYQQTTHLRASRIKTIYNGIDLERFAAAQDKASVRRQLGLPDQGPLLTLVGVMRPGKGQEVFIEAARQVEGAHFLLVGDGDTDQRSRLELLAKGLEDRVHFLGQRMDVPAILSATDIFVLPSDSEAFPTVLIEAAASGLPVIATQVGGIPEIIEEGVTGMLIPPQRPDLLIEKIHFLLDHPVLMEEMGIEANRRARLRFSLDAQAASLTQLYRAVLTETHR